MLGLCVGLWGWCFEWLKEDDSEFIIFRPPLSRIALVARENMETLKTVFMCVIVIYLLFKKERKYYDSRVERKTAMNRGVHDLDRTNRLDDE